MTIKNGILHELIIATDIQMQLLIQPLSHSDTSEYYKMLEYHLGTSIQGKHNQGGKRIRPTILLLCSDPEFSTNQWKNSLPAAAAIELLHNFSLIHDDIQDYSDTRRNRPTVWKKWGIPQAINSGDGIFSLANIAIGNLEKYYPSRIVVQVMQVFNQACLDLTKGQHMDIAFQEMQVVELDQYWTMINYKTATLLSTSAEIGAILAGVKKEELKVYREFGENLGLAYQIKDDILGIWGQEKVTGKSITTDLETSKKTLPVIFGLNRIDKFSERWSKGNINHTEAIDLALLLDEGGAREYSEDYAKKFTSKALRIVEELSLKDENKIALLSLSKNLLNRET